jgi:hypothetical protein
MSDGDDYSSSSSSSSSSLETPQRIDFEDAVPPASTNAAAGAENHSESMFVDKGRSLKALALLSLGLKRDDGSYVFNPSVLPWSAATRKTAIKMTAGELREEVLRRSVAAGNKKHPRPSQWTVTTAMNWLNENPIKNAEEVDFIMSTVSRRIEIAQRSSLEPVVVPGSTASRSRGDGGPGGSWIGKYAYLRLIHAIIDDNDIKAAYLSRLNLPSGRMAIEQRNTPAALASNVWQMVANKWNDPLFLPVTSVKPNTHSDFARPIPLSFDTVSMLQPATMEKVEEKWNSMNLALKRGIQRWERSGQGDGGFLDEDEVVDNEEGDSDEERGGEEGEDDSYDGVGRRFGRLKKRTQRALDKRRNFFDGKSTYLLYLWEMLEEHNLFQSSMQQLHDDVGSVDGSTGVPYAIGGKRKSSNNEDDLSSSAKKSAYSMESSLSKSIEKHGETMLEVAKIAALEQQKNREQALAEQDRKRVDNRINFLRGRINDLRDNKRGMVIRLADPAMQNQAIIDAVMREVNGIEDEIDMNVEELNSLVETKKSNSTPSNL